SGTVGELRDSLMDACSSLEAAIETDDEDERSAGVPPATAEFECDLDRLIGRLADLAAQSSAGRAVREGVRIAIVGRPNVGKSALFNAVLRRSRAIVAPSPGTTRDVIEETVELGGLAITLMDTAGVRRPRGPVEDQGVALSRQAIETADRVLCVLDARRPVSTSDLAIASDAGDRLVAIALNKTDVASLAAVTRAVRRLTLDERSAGVPPATVVAVSASTGQGIQELESLLVRTMTGPSGGLDGILVTHERHARAIGQAHESALRAREGLRRRMPLDVISVDLREAADALADIAGQSLTEDVIGRVFERFCIGK
ncbi:MAG: GTP-binding protein, partial [Armatimonadetes bacterium]|nr:GTP-binding protein [Armatimonadota bacterium]